MRNVFQPRLFMGALVMSLLASLSACQSFSSVDSSNAPLIEEQGRAPGSLTGGL
jgi:hypothetical protein